jgi:histidine ammonia-lyase
MPGAKEGLALTNGTSFMASMIAIGYLKQWRIWENMFALQGLFLNSVGAMSAAFSGSIQEVRGQRGQKIIAEQLLYMVEGSSFQEKNSVQNDYCIRCLPQIFGPKLDLFIDQYPIVCRELNAVTDNPLIFKDEEISRDVEKPVSFEGSQWAILSGGNFHGEYLTSVADCLAMANAKIALTLERQMTYVLNPARNRGKLPVYLITETAKSGLLSGYMIPQYSANALAQKICQLGIPAAIFNITSANESEDIVSYGATAGQRWLEQLTLMEELLAIYGTVMAQAYSIARLGCQKMGGISEEIFNLIGEGYPTAGDDPFAARYAAMGDLLASNILRKRVAFPLKDCLN